MKINAFLRAFAIVSLAFGAFTTQAALADNHPMKPFILAAKASGDMNSVVADVTGKLAGGGFEVAGTYSPYPTATVIVVTNDAMKNAASKSDFGGYGAAARVSVTSHNGEIQVAYSNPNYYAAAYQMSADVSGVTAQLKSALGDQGEYGPKDGLTAKELGKYHYMFGMPYFDEPNILGGAKSHQELVDRVAANLAKGVNDITQVYRIDVPGKEEVVFGVAMNGAKSNINDQDDAYLMSEIDFKDVRSTAHLPYEILVSGNKAYALSARFRIAISFPDLSMMGANSFMNIMGSPVAIQRALTGVAGGEYRGDGKRGD